MCPGFVRVEICEERREKVESDCSGRRHLFVAGGYLRYLGSGRGHGPLFPFARIGAALRIRTRYST